MAHNLNEAGFTQADNKLISAFARSPLTRLEHCILHVIVRQTAGYHRVSAPFPLSFICDAVHAKKQNVSFALRELIRKKVLIETSRATNRNARVLAINENTNEWNFGKIKEHKNAVRSSSELLCREERSTESSQGLPSEVKAVESSTVLLKDDIREPPESSLSLLQGHHGDDPLNIYKYKNKKEAAAVVNNTFSGSRFQLQTAAATSDASYPETEDSQERSFWELFHAAFGRAPNYFEHKEIENLIRENSNFTFSEVYEIYCQSIHKLGISGEDKKTVAYLSGIIRSMMEQALEKREKTAKARGTPAVPIMPAKSEWEPGAFIRMYEEAVGEKFYPDSQDQTGYADKTLF